MATDPDKRDGESDVRSEGAAYGEPEEGPYSRGRAFLRERLTELVGEAEAPVDPATTLDVDPDEPAELPMPDAFWRDRIEQYRERQQSALDARREEYEPAAGEPPEAPTPPPANNWVSIGPTVVREGQARDNPPVSGRVPGVAVAPGGSRLYVGAANGGVWRSTDGGESWTSVMEGFDRNPTQRSADSLACGAIDLVAGGAPSTDRLYLGPGEPYPGYGTYTGIGPVVSTDGGANWGSESVSPGSDSLDGEGFYALKVDPADAERVVAATSRGIYRREPDGSGGFHWDQKTVGGTTGQPFSDVVVARGGGTTTFYAVRHGAAGAGPAAFESTDGATWSALGSGFPTSNVGRTALAVQPSNPDVAYALISDTSRRSYGNTRGIWRYDASDDQWRQVNNHPSVLGGQGWYDIAITVDPGTVDRIYTGGVNFFRSSVSTSGSGASRTYRCSNTNIGGDVHADVHELTFTPGSSYELWAGTDGGVFHSTSPTASPSSTDLFTARNTGLSTMTMNYLAQHPDQDAVLFCGTQDNGGQRYTGEEAWLHVASGDCGATVVNWDDPTEVLATYVRSSVRLSTSGGQRYDFPVDASVPTASAEDVLFYPPMVGTSPDPSTPSAADTVAFGSERPWISTDFGRTWQSVPNDAYPGDALNEVVTSLAFADPDKFYAGTWGGGVYRLSRSGGSWSRTRIDTTGGSNTLALSGPITDVAVDPADASGDSVYVSFGGYGDYRHVWHFDGSQWKARSGPSAGHSDSLLDVHHSALAVDSSDPSNVYAGADIGVWHSDDGGATWDVFSEGLPDAAVKDLLVHTDPRTPDLLRASTHGRGVWERRLDVGPQPGVELYVRDTQLDQGRYPTVNGLTDPTDPSRTVRHYRGPDIKTDAPDSSGSYQVTGDVDFREFVSEVTDESRNVPTKTGPAVTTKAYVQVHNRGVTSADGVRVMLLLANASAGLPPLPAGYESNVQSGTRISTADWETVGITTLDDVTDGYPKVAEFDLDSTMLPPPGSLKGNRHHCLLALVHHPDDRYTSTTTRTDPNSIQTRKAAHKNLTVVKYSGPAQHRTPAVVPVRIYNPSDEEELLSRVTVDLEGYPGRVRFFATPLEFDGDLQEVTEGLGPANDRDVFEEWAKEHLAFVRETQESVHAYNERWAQQRVENVQRALQSDIALTNEAQQPVSLDRIVTDPGDYHVLFLAFDPPDAEVGESFDVEVSHHDAEADEEESLIGGLSTRLQVVPESSEGIDVELWSHDWPFDHWVIRTRLTDETGDRLTPDDDVAVDLALDGGKPVRMAFHDSWGSWYHFLETTDPADVSVDVTATTCREPVEIASASMRGLSED